VTVAARIVLLSLTQSSRGELRPMTRVGQVCKRRVVVTTRGEPVVEAARRMRDEHVGCLVVVEDMPNGVRTPVGVLTDRDIVLRAVAPSDRDLSTLTVGDLLGDQKLVFAFGGDDLAEAIERMQSAGVRRLPVLDACGELEGILAFDDLLEGLAMNASSLVALVSQERRTEKDTPGR
jgi:CBS domain-containing protein